MRVCVCVCVCVCVFTVCQWKVSIKQCSHCDDDGTTFTCGDMYHCTCRSFVLSHHGSHCEVVLCASLQSFNIHTVVCSMLIGNDQLFCTKFVGIGVLYLVPCHYGIEQHGLIDGPLHLDTVRTFRGHLRRPYFRTCEELSVFIDLIMLLGFSN